MVWAGKCLPNLPAARSLLKKKRICASSCQRLFRRWPTRLSFIHVSACIATQTMDIFGLRPIQSVTDYLSPQVIADTDLSSHQCWVKSSRMPSKEKRTCCCKGFAGDRRYAAGNKRRPRDLIQIEFVGSTESRPT